MPYLRLRVQSFRAGQVSLFFTYTKLQLALDCTKTAINKSHYQPPLPTDDIMDLLCLCLTLTDIHCNRKHYKQLHERAVGSPVSVHVAEIVMQNIEEHALATYCETLPIWARSVDDMFTAVHKNKIDELNEHFKMLLLHLLKKRSQMQNVRWPKRVNHKSVYQNTKQFPKTQIDFPKRKLVSQNTN